MKPKNLCILTDSIKKLKRQTKDWVNICAIHIFDKNLSLEYVKTQNNNSLANKNGQKIWIDTTEEDIWMAYKHRKSYST